MKTITESDSNAVSTNSFAAGREITGTELVHNHASNLKSEQL